MRCAAKIFEFIEETVMHRKFFLALAFTLSLSLVSLFVLAKDRTKDSDTAGGAAANQITEGSLQVVDPAGKPLGVAPLKHTDVRAEISGFLSRVVVTQEFENPFKDKIEAVYTFPLPQNAAVDDMTMRVGERTLRGRIKRREEARAIYDAARA